MMLMAKKTPSPKDEAVKLIKELHGIRVVPKTFLAQLENYIQGEYDFLEGEFINSYDWETVLLAYKQSSKQIEWSRRNREFKSNLNMLRYTFKIVEEWLPKIKARKNSVEKVDNGKIEYENIPVTRYSKSRTKVDISRFIGDD